MATVKRTPKKQEEYYDQMAQRLSELVRGMLGPRSAAERIYPKLKRSADDEPPKQEPIQGWAHLKKK